MKLSNKILLGTAIALVLIPIVSMFAISRIYFKVGEYKDTDFVTQPKALNDAEEDFTTQKSGLYKEVVVEGLNGRSASISFMKDAGYGFKIAEAEKDLYTFESLENGVLKIKMKAGQETNMNSVRIKLYAPSLAQLSVQNSDNLSIRYNADSLKLNVIEIKRLYVYEEKALNNIDINAIDVADLDIRKDSWNSLNISASTVKYTNSVMNFSQNQIGNLNLSANGNIKLEFGTNQSEFKTIDIKNLSLQTTGAVNLKMPEVTAEKVSGSISDETQLSIPAKIINMLYKR